MRQGLGVANKSYILRDPEAAAEAIVAAAMRPPGRSSRGRPQPPAEQAPPPPPLPKKKKPPPKKPISTESTSAESSVATSTPTPAPMRPPTLSEVFEKQARKQQSSPKIVPIPPPYTVNWSVLWRGKEVFSGVKSSDRFDFDTFSGDSIRKVSNKADEKGYKTVLQQATAVITCSGNQASITSQCGDSQEWDDVDGVAKTWLEDKRKGVTVKILHTYDRKEASSENESSSSSPMPTSPPKKKRKGRLDKYAFSSDDDSSSADTSSSTESDDSDSSSDKKKKQKKQKDKKKKKMKGTSTTAKQKEFYRRTKELDKKNGRFGHQLMKRWRCDSASCSNKNHYCWQPEGSANTHMTLFDRQICRWNKALTGGKKDVTVDNPPEKVKKQLYAMLAQAQNAKKAHKDKEEEAPPPAPSPTPLPGFQTATSYWQSQSNPQWTPLTQYPYFPPQQPAFQPYGPFSYSTAPFQQVSPFQQAPQQAPQQVSQQVPPPEPTLPKPLPRKRLPSRPSTAENRYEPAPPSSPVQVEGDIGRLRKEYFNWQIGRNRSEQPAIISAFKTVERDMYSIRDIHGFKKPDWSEMKIPPGLGKRLAAEVKIWLRERQNMGQRSSLDDLVTVALAEVEREPLDDLGMDSGVDKI